MNIYIYFLLFSDVMGEGKVVASLIDVFVLQL
jgi:hypothetical protein